MRRLKILLAIVFYFLFSGCNDHQVERCIPGQGIVFDNTKVPVKGDEASPVELVIFGDLQCPGTHVLWWRLKILFSKLKKQEKSAMLKVYFRHFPLSTHNRATSAAKAAAASYLQGNEAFWKMLDLLMKTGDKLTDEHIMTYAANAGLDIDQFEADWKGDSAAKLVSRDYALAIKLALPGTPASIICGIPIWGTADDVIENLEYLLNL